MTTRYSPAQPRRRPLWLGGVLIVAVAGVAALLEWLPTVQHGYQLRLVEGGAQVVLVTGAFGVLCCVMALGIGMGRRGAWMTPR